MDSFSQAELNKLRSEPQSFVPKLAVYRPAKTWRGTLNGAHVKGARTLSIVTNEGSTSDILIDSTLIVDDGINEHRLRIRDASGTFLYVEENNEDWNSGTIMEALLYIEPFAIFPRDVKNSNGSVTHFEDYDTAYTNQNSSYDPVLNLGPAAFALELDCETSGSFANLCIDTSGSFVYGSNITNYLWGVYTGDADPFDAEIIGSNTGSIACYRFWDTGDYYIWCRVTAANGKITTAYRPVIVRCNKPGLPDSPFYNFEISSLEGSRDNSYWDAKISLFEDCDEETFPRNVPIVIYGSYVYGKGASRSTDPIAWYYETGKHQKFVGWVKQETWVHEYKDKGKPITFEATGICGILETLENYPLWLQQAFSPDEWSEITNLTVDKAIFFYLKQRSTLLSIVDWHPCSDPRTMQYANISSGSMLGGVKDFAFGTIYAEVVSDRQSAIWIELQAQMLQDASRPTFATTMLSSTVDDHLNEITIPTTRDEPETSWLSIDGAFNTGTINVPKIAYAPGYVIKSKGGSPEETSGLVLTNSQNDLNILAGRLYALKNNPFKDVDYTTKGNYPYDIAPQSIIEYSELQSGTFREETITLEQYLIRDISDDYSPKKANIYSQLKLEAVIRDYNALVGPNVPKAVYGVQGLFPPDITGIDPDDFNLNWPDFSFDWLDFEDLLPEDLQQEPIPFLDSSAYYILYADGSRLLRCRNFGSGAEIWEQVFANTDLSEANDGIYYITLDSYDPKNNAYIPTGKSGGSNPAYIFGISNLDSPVGGQSVSTLHTITGVGTAISRVHSSINVDGLLLTYFQKPGIPTELWRTRRPSRSGSFSDAAIDTNVASSSEGRASDIGHYWPSASSGRAAVGLRDGGSFDPTVWESLNGGQTHSIAYVGGGGTFVRFVHYPYQGNVEDKKLFIGLHDGKLIRRELNGTTFTELNPTGLGYPLTAFHSYTGDSNYLALIAASGGDPRLFLSTNGGDSWFESARPDGGAFGSQFFENILLGWPFDKDIMVVSYGSGPFRGIWWTNNLFSAAPNPTWYNANGNINSIATYPGISDGVPVWVS